MALLRKALVTPGPIFIFRKRYGGWRSTDLIGNLRIQVSDGAALQNSDGKVHQVSHSLILHPHSNFDRGSVSPACRHDMEASKEEDVPEHLSQPGSFSGDSAPFMATCRDRFSSERPEGLYHVLPNFLLGPGLRVLTRKHTRTESPTGVHQPLPVAFASISTNMETIDVAAMPCQPQSLRRSWRRS